MHSDRRAQVARFHAFFCALLVCCPILLAPGAIDSREPVVLDDVAVCNRPQMRFSSATAN